MRPPGADGGESPGRRRRPTATAVAPAGGGAVCPHPAGVCRPGADGGERPRRWRGPAALVAPPAENGAAGRHGARMAGAGADGGERCRRVGGFNGVRLLRAAGARGGLRRNTGPAGCSVLPGSAGRCVRQRAAVRANRRPRARAPSRRRAARPIAGAGGDRMPSRRYLSRPRGRPRLTAAALSRWAGLLRPGRLGIRTGTDPGMIPQPDAHLLSGWHFWSRSRRSSRTQGAGTTRSYGSGTRRSAARHEERDALVTSLRGVGQPVDEQGP